MYPLCSARLISFRCDHAYFREKEIEARRREEACPESHSPEAWAWSCTLPALTTCTRGRLLLQGERWRGPPAFQARRPHTGSYSLALTSFQLPRPPLLPQVLHPPKRAALKPRSLFCAHAHPFQRGPTPATTPSSRSLGSGPPPRAQVAAVSRTLESPILSSSSATWKSVPSRRSLSPRCFTGKAKRRHRFAQRVKGTCRCMVPGPGHGGWWHSALSTGH